MFLKILFDVLSVIFVIFAIGFCIFSHELGHFLAAKLLGLHVDAFSIGFKAFWKKKYRGVEYRLGWIPIGGYCEIPQIDATGEKPKAADGTELPRAKPLQKIVTAVAGPLFNIISGALIACVIWVWGMPQATPKMKSITVLAIDEQGPEYAAGLRPGDKIVKLNGEPFDCNWEKFLEKLIYTNGEVELTVERGGKTHVFHYTQKVNRKSFRNAKLADEGLPSPLFAPLIPIELVPEKGGAAEKAGIKTGDRILEIDGKGGIGEHNFQDVMDLSRGRPLKMKLLRGGGVVELEVAPHSAGEAPYYLIGVMMSQAEGGLKLAKVNAGGAADKAGLKPGDVIDAVDGRKPEDVAAFRKILDKSAGKPVVLTVRRPDDETVKVELVADRYEPMTIDANTPCDAHPSPWDQFLSTLTSSYKALSGFGITIGKKLGLTKKESSIKPRHVSGVVGMGTVLFKAAHYSFSGFVYLMVLISFALAIFNLLPLPVLDGGHILFGCIELVIRRPLPVKVVKVLYITFAVLLILLMIYATFNDVRRIYESSRKEEPAKAKAEPETKPVKPTGPEVKPAK